MEETLAEVRPEVVSAAEVREAVVRAAVAWAEESSARAEFDHCSYTCFRS